MYLLVYVYDILINDRIHCMNLYDAKYNLTEELAGLEPVQDKARYDVVSKKLEDLIMIYNLSYCVDQAWPWLNL